MGIAIYAPMKFRGDDVNQVDGAALTTRPERCILPL
jgi:hypothetical protein